MVSRIRGGPVIRRLAAAASAAGFFAHACWVAWAPSSSVFYGLVAVVATAYGYRLLRRCERLMPRPAAVSADDGVPRLSDCNRCGAKGSLRAQVFGGSTIIECCACGALKGSRQRSADR